MAKPLIAWKSMLRESATTITDPGTASGYSISDIKDLRSFKIWKSNSTTKPKNIDIDAGAGGATADYIALVNHNLFTLGATVEVFSGTSSPAGTQRLAPTALTENGVSYIGFAAPAAVRYWRIQITVAGASFASAPYIGECFLGLKTEVDYMAPSLDPFLTHVEVAGARSKGGHFLGATTRGKAHRGVLTVGAAGTVRSAFTSDLNSFIDTHANLRKPFVFVLDSADADFKAGKYLRMSDDGKVERMAVGGSWARMTFSFPVEEAYMEPAA